MSAPAPEITVIPVSVMMRRTEKTRGRWTYPVWEVIGLLPDDSGVAGPPHGRLVHVDGPTQDYLWQGLRVRLVRSNAETYWFNLTSTSPSAFVICREDPEWGLAPLTVTLDQDESTRNVESDGEVFAATIPERVLDAVERFVVAHYRPTERGGGRRKRRKPHDGQASGSDD
jgi:hypothetical protein